MRDFRQMRLQHGQQAIIRRGGNQDFRLGVIDDVGEFSSGQEPVERNKHRAGLERGKHAHDKFRAIRHQHADFIIIFDPQRIQRPP